jgi:hypothetical protein
MRFALIEEKHTIAVGETAKGIKEWIEKVKERRYKELIHEECFSLLPAVYANLEYKGKRAHQTREGFKTI